MGMKAMKVMKAMKAKGTAMKAMKGMKAMKKAMKKSKIAKGKMAKSQVFKGRKEKTVGGLTAAKLKKNSQGKVVSKAQSLAQKKAFKGSRFEAWIKACQAARKALGVKGFAAVGGKTAQGKALYAKAKAIFNA